MVRCAVVLWDGQVVREGVDVVAARHASSLFGREPQAPERALAMHGHVIPGQPHHPVSCELEVGVAVSVAFAIAPGAVELEAVELDGEALLWPEGIDFVGGFLSFNCGIEDGRRYVAGGLYQCFE